MLRAKGVVQHTGKVSAVHLAEEPEMNEVGYENDDDDDDDDSDY